MNLTLSLDDDLVAEARRRAGRLGTSVNQLVRDYLAQFAGRDAAAADAAEFAALSRRPAGRRRGWRFRREALHARR